MISILNGLSTEVSFLPAPTRVLNIVDKALIIVDKVLNIVDKILDMETEDDHHEMIMGNYGGGFS
jgi:hypothetical protein